MAKIKSIKRKLGVPRFARVQVALLLREMATSYGRSYAGYLWAVVDPIGAIAVLSLAFSLAFKSPALGDTFPLFYATGYLPFYVYNVMQQKTAVAIKENRNLLFYPRVTYIDAFVSRYVLHLLTQILVAIIVLGSILFIFDVHTQIRLQACIQAVFVASILGLGIGVLNCVFFYIFPSWRNIWGIVTKPLFLLSCIFYLFDTLPTWAQAILWFNPLIHVVGILRVGIYPIYDGDYINLLYPLSIGLITLTLGLLLLRRFASEILNN